MQLETGLAVWQMVTEKGTLDGVMVAFCVVP